MANCLIIDPPLEWEIVVEWCVAILHGKNLKSSLSKLYFEATVYHLWKQMNDLLHGNTLRTKEASDQVGGEIENSG